MAEIYAGGKRKIDVENDGSAVVLHKRQRRLPSSSSYPSIRFTAMKGSTSDGDITNGKKSAGFLNADYISVKASTAAPVEEIHLVHSLSQLDGKSPPVWANTRSALCDAVPYFKSHEGGNYNKEGVTHGILLDGIGSARDYVDGTVIITAIGGGRAIDAETGRMARKADQDESSRYYQCFRKSQRDGHSVMVIIGDKNEMMNPPHPYCVLGEYQITNIWMEKFPDANGRRFSSWMIRLEKIDFSEISWFTKEEDPSHNFTVGEYICDSGKCEYCQTSSKRIYDVGWACLNHHCIRFFQFLIKMDGKSQFQQVISSEVQYSREFLRERTNHQRTIRHRHAIVPDLPTINDKISFGTEKEFKRGIVCPKCRCASRRVFWNEWKCEAGNCDFTHKLVTRVYPLIEINKETQRAKRKKTLKVDEELVEQWETTIAGYEVEVFTLPDENGKTCGTVMVFRATQEICSKEDGPNDLFLAMQNQESDLKLRRNAAIHRGRRNEELISHFISNWGAPYKFGVTVDTTAFFDAPEEILRGLAQLSWAQEMGIEATKKQFLQDHTDYSPDSMSLKSEPFNELLSLGYFENSYHDDGEKELGPTVATLSLGSPSVMRFRPKRKNQIGTPGKNKSGLKAPVITFPLYHGDICIMHGVDVHKYYEHEVKPNGKLRFAMTSRFVRPETMPTIEAREACIANGKIPPHNHRLAYKGADDNIDPENTTSRQSLIVKLYVSPKKLAEMGKKSHKGIPSTRGPVIESGDSDNETTVSFRGLDDVQGHHSTPDSVNTF